MTRFLWVVVFLSLLWGLYRMRDLRRSEAANRRVEISLDYDGFVDLCQKEGLPLEPALRRMRALGVTSVAPSETTLDELRQSGQAAVIQGGDSALFKTAPHPKTRSPHFIVMIRDAALRRWLGRSFSALLGKNQFQNVAGGFLIRGRWDNLSQTGWGIYPPSVRPAADLGFYTDPRIANRDEMNEARAAYLLSNIASLPNASAVIFSGLRNEALGYDHGIPWTADALRARGIRFGYVETYDPGRDVKGAPDLARRIPDLTVKVQSLNFPPFARIGADKAADIFLLGVRERNVRVIYFRPLLNNAEGKSLWDMNADFLRQFQAGLQKFGFVLGKAEPFAVKAASFWGTALCALGILAATFLLIRLFVEIPVFWPAAFAAAVWVSFRLAAPAPARFVLAFWAACVFPVLGIVLFFPSRTAGFFRSALALVEASLVTAAGGILISAVLADDLTVLGIETFRGVKLAFLIPVVLAPWLAWLRRPPPGGFLNPRQAFEKFSSPLQKPLRVSHALVFLLAAAAAAFMLLRSGNAVPEGAVPVWERALRDHLETLLIARPRFKEFLTGHPFFIGAAALGLESAAAVFLLAPAALGQADILDSFAHVHTPVDLTLLRTFHGIWIGILIGWVLRRALVRARSWRLFTG